MHRRGPKTSAHHRRFASIGQAASLADGPLLWPAPAPARCLRARPRRAAETASAHCMGTCAPSKSRAPAWRSSASRPRLVRVSSTARRCESLYVRAMSSVLAWPSASATDTLRRESGPVDRSRTRRAAGRAHGTPCCALLRRGIAPRGRSHRARSWGPVNPRPRTVRTTLPGPQTALNGESRALPGFAPGCVRATAPVRWAIPLRNSPGDGHVAVVLAACCGEHGDGGRRDSRDRSHGLCDSICLHDLR